MNETPATMNQTYVMFSHRGARYGLDVHAVREIVWLPELSPIEELPHYIAGVFNLHGRVLPVMDLCLRFGHPREHYDRSDRVIVLDGDAGSVGIIANALHDVTSIAPEAIDDVRCYQGAGGEAQFVFGQTRLEDGLAMLLDVAALLRSTPPEVELGTDPRPSSAAELSRLFGELSPGDTALLRSRTRFLAEPHREGERSGLEAYAVIRLDDELFGLPLGVVQEFAHSLAVTPVPCCPPHIVGNMNLRGDILTLADIRPTLGMPMDDPANEVAVVRVGDLLLGLTATQIVTIAHLAPADIVAAPLASDDTGKAYCSGVATVNGRAVGILNLELILAGRRLQVAEEVM